ncbi:helix-turn-helix domain-containing protein [Sphingomonas azotifigens]|uniref:helix-turn-helix domain-containing protein n=1 Tax=Sphingomonas azotifigens TaxID=330920 RepID=UPI0014300947|nr:helix-turn-helix transcriptional regulator [Sphingomonas azotifigens]
MPYSTLPESWIHAAATLRARRESVGMSLAQLASRTRIGQNYLAAIEEARFDRCGAAIYAIGFTRSVARTLELPEGPIVAAVRDGHAVAPTSAVPAPPPAPPRRLVPNLGIAATAALVLSLLGSVRP